MIKFGHKGDFSKTTKFLNNAKERDRIEVILAKYGKEGVAALASATPSDSGQTANSWFYEIERTRNGATLSFCNSNINDGVSIAVIIQFGHGTGTGGWVQGRDYINPAIQPIFDRIADEAWREVTKL